MNKTILKIVSVLLVVVAVVVASALVASAKGVVRHGPAGGATFSRGIPTPSLPTPYPGPINQPLAPSGGQYTPPQNTGVVPPSISGAQQQVRPVIPAGQLQQPVTTGANPVQPVTGGNTVAYDKPKPTPQPTPTETFGLNYGKIEQTYRQNPNVGTPSGGTAGLTPSIPIPPPVTSAQQPVQTGGAPFGGNAGIAKPVQPTSVPTEDLSLNYNNPVNTNTPQKPAGTMTGGAPVGGNAGITPSIPIPPPVTSAQQPVQPYQQGGQVQAPVYGSQPQQPSSGEKPEAPPKFEGIQITKPVDIATPKLYQP